MASAILTFDDIEDPPSPVLTFDDVDPDPTVTERAIDMARQFAKAYGRGVAGTSRAAATLAKVLDEAVPLPGSRTADTELQDYFLWKIADAVEETVDEAAGSDDPRLRDSITGDVGAGFGSVGAMLTGGLAAKALRAPRLVATAVVPGTIGAGMGAGAQHEQAEAAGASEEEQELAAKWGAVVGLTELLPVGRLMNRFDRATGGQLSRRLKHVVTQAARGFAEESTQEIIQGMLDNTIAQKIYDAEKPLFEEVARAGGVGGFVGATMSTIASMIGLRRARRYHNRALDAEKLTYRRMDSAEEDAQRVANETPEVARRILKNADENQGTPSRGILEKAGIIRTKVGQRREFAAHLRTAMDQAAATTDEEQTSGLQDQEERQGGEVGQADQVRREGQSVPDESVARDQAQAEEAGPVTEQAAAAAPEGAPPVAKRQRRVGVRASERKMLDIFEAKRDLLAPDIEAFEAEIRAPEATEEPQIRPGYTFKDTPLNRQHAKEVKDRLPKHLQVNITLVKPDAPGASAADAADIFADIGPDRMAEAVLMHANEGEQARIRALQEAAAKRPEDFTAEELFEIQRYEQVQHSPETAELAKGKNAEVIQGSELAVGDELTIAGEPYSVTEYNPERGSVLVKNGMTHEVFDETELAIDKGSLKKGEGDVSFAPRDLLGRKVYEPATGEQKGLEFETDLAGETTTESGAITKEGKLRIDRDKAAEKRQTRELEETGQQVMFGQFPEQVTRPAQQIPDWRSAAAETDIGRKLVTKITKDPKGEKVGLRSIIEFLGERLGTMIRVSREQTTSRNPEQYEPAHHLLRTRYPSSQITLHGLGHALHTLMTDTYPDRVDQMENALNAIANMDDSFASDVTPIEGMAEWVRRYLFDPASLPSDLNSRIEQWIDDVLPGMKRQLRDASRAMAVHQQRDAMSLLRSYQSDKPKRPASQYFMEPFQRLMGTWVGPSAIPDHVKRLVFGRLKKFNERLVQNFWDDIQGGEADFSIATDDLIRAQADVKAAFSHRDGSLQVLQHGDGFGWLKPEQVKMLEDAGLKLPETNPGHGEYLVLHPTSFMHIMNQIPKAEEADFSLYGQYRVAVHRAETKGHAYSGLSEGMTPEIVRREFIEPMEREHPEWDRVFREVNEFANQTLLLPVLSGELTVKEAANIVNAWEDYWPLPRFTENIGTGPGGRRDAAITDSGLRRAKGSPLAFKGDIIASMYDVINKRMTAYYANRAKLAMFTLADELARLDAPPEYRDVLQQILPKLHLDTEKVATAQPEELARAIADYINKRDGLEGEDAIKPNEIAADIPAMPLFRATGPKAMHVVGAFRPGKGIEYRQSIDPVIYSMFEWAQSGSTQPVKALRWLNKLFGPFNRTWRQSRTAEAVFMVWSPFRDAVTNLIVTDPKNLREATLGYHFARGMVGRITGNMSETALRMGEQMSMSLDAVDRIEHRTLRDKFIAELKEGMTPELRNASWADRIAGVGSVGLNATVKPVQMAQWAIGAQWLSSQIEAAPRTSAAETALQRGKTTAEALSARDRASGFFIQRPMGPNVAAAYKLAVFFNPGIQIMYQMYSMFSNPDPRVRARLFKFKLPMLATQTAAAAVITFLLTSDDDREKLRETPDEERLKFMTLFGKYRIPFDYGFAGAVQSAVYNTTMGFLLDDYVAPDKAAWEMLKRLAPAVADPTGTAAGWLQPIAQTTAELQINHNFFFGSKIVPEWMEKSPDAMQTYDDTPSTYKVAGRLLDISPIRIQYAVRNIMGSQMDNMIKSAEALINGKGFADAADWPVIGRLFTRTPDGWRAQSVKDVAEVGDRFSALRELANEMHLAGKGDTEEFKELTSEMASIENKYRAYLQIRKYSKLTNHEREQPQPDQEKIKRLKSRMVTIAQQALREQEVDGVVTPRAFKPSRDAEQSSLNGAIRRLGNPKTKSVDVRNDAALLDVLDVSRSDIEKFLIREYKSPSTRSAKRRHIYFRLRRKEEN